MRLPLLTRSRITMVGLVAASVLLGGCANDATAPAKVTADVTRSVTSPFVPTAAAKSLVGVSDGTYTFTVDPTRAQSLVLGANLLYLPAGAICDIATSSYGAGHWDERCAPEHGTLTITAVVKNAASARPSIDFYPAMRFNPSANVTLFMYVPRSERNHTGKTPSLVMNYCNDKGACVDESLTDPSLVTMTDRSNSVVWRRIKHFSGYIIATGLVDDLGNLLN